MVDPPMHVFTTAESSTIVSTVQPDEITTTWLPFARSRTIQDFVLIWLDPDMDESNDACRNSITQLQQILSSISVFNNTDRCIDFLTDIKYETVFMVVSDAFCETTISFVHQMSQLESLYVLCKNESTCKIDVKQWSKVRGVYTQMNQICEAVKISARQCDRNSILFSVITCSDASNENLNQLDQSFMYSQVLKEILLEIKFNQQSLKDFVTYCHESKCAESSSIDRFYQEYHCHSPIWWYTSPFFVYYMLNRALRTQEIDTIIKMGFFVSDLHRHIEKLHSDQSSNYQMQSLILYHHSIIFCQQASIGTSHLPLLKVMLPIPT